MRRAKKNYCEHGFSLIEMMMVLAILMLVMGVTMRAIMDVEKRQRTEEAKVDLNQEGREFVDQIVRDLHQSGYPTAYMYSPAPTGPGQVATGIQAATQTSIQFQGDVDGGGTVEQVNYQLITDLTAAPAGQCPCILQRSMVPVGTAVSYSTEVDQVINSMGTAGGAWTVAGNFTPIGGQAQTGVNNTYYASFKTQPVFQYFDGGGNELVPPIADLTQIKSVRITVNTITRQPDPVTGAYQAVSMTASARIANR